MKLNHKQKVSLARKLMDRVELKTSNRIQIPKFPHGTMISRLFNSDNWTTRKLARAGKLNVIPLTESQDAIPSETNTDSPRPTV